MGGVVSLVPESLDAFAELAVALGMVDGTGRVNTDWFADPARETAKLLAWLDRAQEGRS